MKRLILDNLLEWKAQESRKPVLLDGARQVGKSYLIEQIFSQRFQKVHKIDFLENSEFHEVFEQSLDPSKILKAVELELGQKIDLETDLIFFDEIGECPRAVNSLKYFCEKMPQIYLCASGSNVGLLNSFPVGKTFNLHLCPMNFYEFLLASGEEMLIEEFENQSFDFIVHKKLWRKLLDYYYVGGMPEAVRAWFENENISDKCSAVEKVHADLILGYQRDFGKYSGKVNALHIESVFNSVATRLSQTEDDSVKRFSFKNVVEKKNRYQQLRGPIDFLEKCNLALKNYVIEAKPDSSIESSRKENIFKLFFFDVGLLCHKLGVQYKEIQKENFYSKGFIAENFVQCELISAGMNYTYSWAKGRAEIEFLLKDWSGDFFPVEVKSGKRLKAKSLQSYVNRYEPNQVYKLSALAGQKEKIGSQYTWPLYFAKYLGTQKD